ncbi:Hypothetical predicted protein, partial [Marmota monax]
ENFSLLTSNCRTDPSASTRAEDAPWARVLRYTEAAGWREPQRLVLVRKLSPRVHEQPAAQVRSLSHRNSLAPGPPRPALRPCRPGSRPRGPARDVGETRKEARPLPGRRRRSVSRPRGPGPWGSARAARARAAGGGRGRQSGCGGAGGRAAGGGGLGSRLCPVGRRLLSPGRRVSAGAPGAKENLTDPRPSSRRCPAGRPLAPQLSA